MSNQINDGGPAFPNVPPDSQYSKWDMGMTLRDYFAAAALHVQANQFIDPHEHRELLAQECYDIADAMLKVREVKP